MRSKDTYNKIKLFFNFVDFEEYITSLEDLKEKVAICDYDIAILDTKIWWDEEGIKILNENDIPTILFNENLEELSEKLNESIENIQAEELRIEEELNKKEIIEVEKIVEKIIEVEKPIIIEKEVQKEIEIEVINNANIAVISNCSNGKSFITWNIAHGFANRGYNTSILNLDRGYSANIYYSIDEEEERALRNISKLKNFNKILHKAYYVNENLRIFTNELCSKEELNNEEFLKISNLVQANSDITIIDCKSEINDLLKSAISYSSTVLFIFDNDNMHYNLNLKMLEEISDVFNPQKIIVVLNNVFYEGAELKNTIKFIKNMGLDFRDIVTIGNCGADATDMMFTDTCPYISSKNEKFKNDMDRLMDSLKAKSKKKTIFQKLFKK